MKRLRPFFLLFLSALCLAGCFQDIPSREKGDLLLTVCCDTDLLTKSQEMAGLTPYNENRIETVDFFFYPGEAPAGSTPAVYHVRVTESPAQQVTAAHKLKLGTGYVDLIFPSGANKATVYAVVNHPGTLVPNEADLSGFSIDALEAIVVTTDFPQREINFLQPNFLMSGRNVIQRSTSSGGDVVATGEIPVRRLAAKLTVSINPESTILLDRKGTPSDPDDDEKWHPVLSSMEIYLVDGVNNARLGGNAETTSPSYFSYVDRDLNVNKSRHYFRDEATPYMAPTTEGDNTYYNTFPMYTYPLHWGRVEVSADNGKKAPSLKMVITWQREQDDVNGYSFVERQYYYKIFIPDDPDDSATGDDKRSFRRNNWYHYNVDVGILGAETDEGAVKITPSCYIVDWQNMSSLLKQASIGSARFLSADTTLTLHNISTVVSIPYITSHPVVIVPGSIVATRPYYGDKTSGNALGGTIRKAGAGDIYPKDSYYLTYNASQRAALNDRNEWVTLNDMGTAVLFQHKLENDYRVANFDYSPYTVTFSIIHQDLLTNPDPNIDVSKYRKTIKIIQYPGIYIEALANSDATVQHVSGKIYTSDYWGYVYVDNQQPARGRDLPEEGQDGINEFNAIQPAALRNYLHWHAISYTGGSRDIFKINASTLPEDSDFVIGDPRSTEENNLSFSNNPATYDYTYKGTTTTYHLDGFRPGPHINALGEIDRTDWVLSYYYPTEKSTRTYDMVAPSYRIASKHGGVEFNGISYAEAQRRCASFQEDGFPAGRWRLPTRGEIRFIAYLSANHAFTFLFSTGGTYWSANGAIKVNNNTVEDVSNTTALARCVYDSWYWGDDQHEPRDQFVWGDRKILR